MDISTKLTNFISAYTIVTDDFNNMIFGGLWNTIDGDAVDAMYAGSTTKHPLTHGHDHRGQHIDGSSQKILLTDGAMITGQLQHPYLADDAVADRNVQKFIDETQAIPWYEEIDGIKYYKLDLSMFTGGHGAFIEVPADNLIKTTSEDYSDSGYDFVFGSSSLADLADGTNGTHRFTFDRSNGSFRAGRAETGQWDTQGLYSAAFGNNNTVEGDFSSAAGGKSHYIDQQSSFNFIGGGESNQVSTASTFSSVSGGQSNEVHASIGCYIGGGYQNDVTSAIKSGMVCGHQNSIVEYAAGATSKYNFVGSGYQNDIFSTDYSSIVGGKQNLLTAFDDRLESQGANVIAGGAENKIDSGWDSGTLTHSGGSVYRSSIVGGASNQIATSSDPSNVIPNSFIGGGYANVITQDRSAHHPGERISYAFVGGGHSNSIHKSGAYGASIVGGKGNVIKGLEVNVLMGLCTASFIGAGARNKIFDSDYSSILSGGDISDASKGNAIIGGYGFDPNTATEFEPIYNTIICGASNVIGDSVNFDYTTEAGAPTDVARWSTILNGLSNKIVSSGEECDFATVIGGNLNEIHMSNNSLSLGGDQNVIFMGDHNVIYGTNQTMAKNSLGNSLRESFVFGFTTSDTFDEGTGQAIPKKGLAPYDADAMGVVSSYKNGSIFCIGNNVSHDDNSSQFAVGINTYQPAPYHPNGAAHSEGLHIVGPFPLGGPEQEPTPLKLTNLSPFNDNSTFKYLVVDSKADGNVYVLHDDIVPMTHMHSDTAPTMGGDMNTGGNEIYADADVDIKINPTGNGRVVLKGIAFPTSDGSPNQVLTTDGGGDLSWQDPAGGAVTSVNGDTGVVTLTTDDVNEGVTNQYYTDVKARNSISASGDLSYDNSTGELGFTETFTVLSDDANPHLGGNLNVNGNDIVSSGNNNINITPAGNGAVVLKGMAFPNADGGAGQVLQTDGNNALSWVTISSGGAVDSVNGETGVVTLDSDDIAEGVNNQYYTDARARSSISAGGDLSYDSGTGALSYTMPAVTTTVNGQNGDVTLTQNDIAYNFLSVNLDNNGQIYLVDKAVANGTYYNVYDKVGNNTGMISLSSGEWMTGSRFEIHNTGTFNINISTQSGTDSLNLYLRHQVYISFFTPFF